MRVTIFFSLSAALWKLSSGAGDGADAGAEDAVDVGDPDASEAVGDGAFMTIFSDMELVGCGLLIWPFNW